MRTSLNEIKEIEGHLLGNHSTPDALLFEAKLVLDTGLRDKLVLQQNVYKAVQQYSRKSLKLEIEAAYGQLAQPEHRGFVQHVMNLFLKR